MVVTQLKILVKKTAFENQKLIFKTPKLNFKTPKLLSPALSLQVLGWIPHRKFALVLSTTQDSFNILRDDN